MTSDELIELVRRTPEFVDWIGDDDRDSWPYVVCEVCGARGRLGCFEHENDCLRKRFQEEYGKESL